MPAVAAPRRRLNPHLLRRIKQSGLNLTRLAVAAGFQQYTEFYYFIRRIEVIGTPLNINRLHRLADAVDFPRDQIFLDEPREVTR